MSGLQGKRWHFFIWDDHNESHLSEHGINPWEAEQVFLTDMLLRRIRKNTAPENIELMVDRMLDEI
jgi:uncharacterized DUF497 family protein